LGEQLEIAKASLASIDRIEVVSTGAEYILGRMTSSYLQQVKPKKIPDLPAVDSFGLFLPGLTPLSNTFQKSVDHKLFPKGRSLTNFVVSDTSYQLLFKQVSGVSIRICYYCTSHAQDFKYLHIKLFEYLSTQKAKKLETVH
jgi:hypothetical protein